jgi:hypothetical protein
MTLIKEFGVNKILIFLILVSLYSCKENEFLYSGVNETYIYTYYVNDSINFSVKLAGDIKKYEDAQELKQKLKLYKNKRYYSNVIEFFKSSSEPFYDLFLFKFDNTNQINSFLKHNNLVKFKDSLNNSNYEVIDSINCCYGKTLFHNKSPILLLAYSKNKNYFNLMIEEFSDVFLQMIYNEGYKGILPSPFAIANDNAFNSSDNLINYLKPIKTLIKYENLYGLKDFAYVQAVCTYSCRITNSNIFKKYLINYYNLVYFDSIPTEKFTTNESAHKEILNIASNSSLMMFNENHFEVKHRKLIKYLLKDFYDLGYRYLALEALFENNKLLNDRKYPLQKSGFYTQEPEMADLIREAIKLGFYVFGYDSFGKGNRELNQAQNIYNISFGIDSTAKVLVLGGHNHIYEKEIQNKKWMAFYLKNNYGINPVTFSQTAVRPNHNFWLGLTKNELLSNQPVDYLISNNISDNNFNDFHTVQLNIQLPYSNLKNDLILSIFLTSEFENDKTSIPIKNLIIPYKDNSVYVNLKKGDYTYLIKNINGDILLQRYFINE